VEAALAQLCGEIVDVVRDGMDPGCMEALVLIGGYGRGEGGVRVVGAREQPHNNLDLLLLTRGLSRAAGNTLKQRLAPTLNALGSTMGLGIDLSVLPAASLQRARTLVLWYDMRYGHKTLAGNEAFVPSLEQFTLDSVPATDFLRLMVNRGTLFLLNDLILARGNGSPSLRRAVIKHTFKAIIGYGDALLFQHGRYHWSYRAKQRAMREISHIHPEMARVYNDALEFRFRPDYDRFDAIDLAQWTQGFRDSLADVHLGFERWRLDAPQLEWPQYARQTLRREIVDGLAGPRATARSLRNALTTPFIQSWLAPDMSLGCRMGGRRARLDAAFPTLAYRHTDAEAPALARRLLGAGTTEHLDLVDAYLDLWGVHGDENLGAVLKNLQLKERRPAPAAAYRRAS
jgi:hypothetical protein